MQHSRLIYIKLLIALMHNYDFVEIIKREIKAFKYLFKAGEDILVNR